ncbi:MAG: hypothetical protein KA754_05075, partial [Corallincola sp.]|nr:hypothetical protein [Corallincola sp.]
MTALQLSAQTPHHPDLSAAICHLGPLPGQPLTAAAAAVLFAQVGQPPAALVGCSQTPPLLWLLAIERYPQAQRCFYDHQQQQWLAWPPLATTTAAAPAAPVQAKAAAKVEAAQSTTAPTAAAPVTPAVAAAPGSDAKPT